MIEAARKVHDETNLQRLIDDTVNRKVHHLSKDTHEKALTGAYTKLYQMVEQADDKAIYFGGAHVRMSNNAGRLIESREFT